MSELTKIPVMLGLVRMNLEWLKRNYSSLKKEYDNKWVLIHDQKVVGCGDTFDEMLPETKKYEPSSVLLEYIHSKEVAMFF